MPGESSVRVLSGMTQSWVCTSTQDSPYSLRTTTSVHHHARDLSMDDLLLIVEVEHVDRGHLGGGAAGPC